MPLDFAYLNLLRSIWGSYFRTFPKFTGVGTDPVTGMRRIFYSSEHGPITVEMGRKDESDAGVR
jgi:hypothetical protein